MAIFRQMGLPVAAILITSLLSGCASVQNQSAESSNGATNQALMTHELEPFQCGSMARLHTFDGILLASQPGPADFAKLSDLGVKTVINLRHEAEIKDFNEGQVVNDDGMSYINLPFGGPDELTEAVFDKARELLRTSSRPILLHCSSANRVGAVWLPYRVLDGGLTWDQALAEAREVGLRSPGLEASAKAYIDSHSR